MLVHICTTHPLVFQTIHRILAGDRKLRPLLVPHPIDVDIHDVPDRIGVVILDTCSEDNSLKMVARCKPRDCYCVALLPSQESSSRQREIQLLNLGVRGIVTVSKVMERELPWAVHAVMRGELWVKRSVIDEYVSQTNLYRTCLVPYSDRLTAREHQVISCIINGFSNKQISDVLHISERTAKFHVANIFQKMNVTSRSTLLSGLQCPHRATA